MVADSTQEDEIEDAVEVVIGDKNLATAFEDQSDDEIEEDDLVVEDEGYSIGSIVWIKVGRLWYPGKVISQVDVIEEMVEGHIFVKRSSKNDEINKAYGLALSEQLGDII